MATLYELSGDYLQVQRMIEDGFEGLEDTLESLQGPLHEKLEAYGMVIRNIESDVEGLKAEEKRLAERRKVMENGIKRMKTSIHETMSSTGEKKIKGEKFTFTIQKNPPSLKVVDESLIPEIFFDEQKPTLNKKLLMESIKDGFEYEGAQISQGESLRIR
ncbi:siphovirus Gp157 family protein [Sporosarcina sp. P34]|uniref:siphovirus Gp157 family protein n=1 Tax=Sporosarcina sp. P34 TaxID=2048247 RepID=UPI0013041E55|nr:siphovirus Gp157 family protein [Sporosarcina sp. P34]